LNRIARMSARERAEIFGETADRKGLANAIVEKDFWVCWILKQLFSIPDLEGRLLFKGGTSLSKVFHAIERFSEDLDLAVDYTALGFTGDRDPRQEGISKSRRTVIPEQMMEACRGYISGPFLDVLRARIQGVLGDPLIEWPRAAAAPSSISIRRRLVIMLVFCGLKFIYSLSEFSVTRFILMKTKHLTT